MSRGLEEMSGEALVEYLKEERILQEVLNIIKKRGSLNETWTWFDLEVDDIEWDWWDFMRFIHDTLPNKIEEVVEKAGLHLWSMYHTRDFKREHGLPFYIARVKGDGEDEQYTLMLDVINCGGDEVNIYSLLIVDGNKGWTKIPKLYEPV